MQVVTCRVGQPLPLGEASHILVHRRQGERLVLGATAPAGTELILAGAPLRPITGADGEWSYLFSLLATRRFVFGRFEVSVWLPGEVVPLAAACEDWLHVGIAARWSGSGRKPTMRIGLEAFSTGIRHTPASPGPGGVMVDAGFSSSNR